MNAAIKHRLMRWILPISAACVLGGAFKAVLIVHAPRKARVMSMALLTPVTRIAAADNHFGLRLFETVYRVEAAKNINTNVCVSPLSVALCLQMTYNGANGRTRGAMSRALELGGMTRDDVNKANEALLTALDYADKSNAAHQSAPGGAQSILAPSAQIVRDKDAPQLDIADALWLKDARAARPDFVLRTRTCYRAEVSGLEGAPGSINKWVDTRTHGRITQIVSDADVRGVAALLVNTVYFKGAWQLPFYKESTSDRPFHLADGTTRTSRMMTQNESFFYYAGDGLQVISLPYHHSYRESRADLDMVIVLPDLGTSLDAFLPRVTPENWRQWIYKMTERRGTVELPRFRAEYGTDLTTVLSALGMGAAFEPGADFSAMSRDNLFVSKVMHKTTISVDEKGTEAAAATTVGMLGLSDTFGTHPFQMTMDRPFLYAIRDWQSGALLFVGALANPG